MWEGITEEHEREILKLINLLPKNQVFIWCLDSLPNVLAELIAKSDIENIKSVSWTPFGFDSDTFLLDHEILMSFEIEKTGTFNFILERRKQ